MNQKLQEFSFTDPNTILKLYGLVFFYNIVLLYSRDTKDSYTQESFITQENAQENEQSTSESIFDMIIEDVD